MKRNKLLTMLVIGTLVISLFSGCASKTEPQTPISNQSKPTEQALVVEEKKELTPEEEQAKENFANSTAQNDTDVGLRNIKIDTAETDLTTEQKRVIEYFDDDYFSIPSYEFLRRYPNVFMGAQITAWGTVSKVISMDENNYKLALWLNVGPVEYEYESNNPKYEGHFLIVEGQTGNTWYMEGDTLFVYGRYTGIETIEIDQASHTLPVISTHRAIFDTSDKPNSLYRYIEKFDVNFIKQVAQTIFGDDIEVRNPIVGTDITEMHQGLWGESAGTNPCYVVELEDQSNAKFTKYFFYAAADHTVWSQGRIEDAKDSISRYSEGTSISRNIEFSADFEHFFLFTYDSALEILTLEYYDVTFDKVWKREFTETTSAVYDYTKNNIYLVANNELYIINMETGEDTYSPAFIGEKQDLRKLPDGILTVGKNKSDAIIKSDLDGNMIWKTNLSVDPVSVEGIQLINDTIVIEYLCVGDMLETRYVVLDSATGSILLDAVPIA